MRLPFSYFTDNLTSYSCKNPVTQTPSPAVQSLPLPALALLGIPGAVFFLWMFYHSLVSTFILTWRVLVDLVLPLSTCVFATAVFLVPNPMHALLSLLGVFFTSVLFYLAVGIGFVGLVFLIVYVGAVAVLFLFVIMLLNVKSLTSKDALLRHITQLLAIMTATTLFQQLYFHVFAAANYILARANTLVSSLELTSAEAVLYYIRFGAADINRVTSLYGEHCLPLYTTIAFLLISLLGAIILATVTTERAIALADIRVYSNFVAANAALLLLPILGALFVIFHLDFFIDFFSQLLILLFDNYGIVFMSMYTPMSERNSGFMKYVCAYGDAVPYRTTAKNYRILLPKIVALRTPTGVFFRQRIDRRLKARLERAKEKANEKLKAAGKKPAKSKEEPKKTTHKPLFRRARFAAFTYFASKAGFAGRRAAVSKRKRQYFDERGWWRPRSHVRQWLVAFVKVKPAVSAIIWKWNARRLLPHAQKTMRRARWLWRWRPERALSLLRTSVGSVVENNIEWKFYISKGWSPLEWESGLRSAPISASKLGVFRYLRYLYNTRLFPVLFYYAGRGRAFFSIWILMVLVLPFFEVPFPWFFDEYDVLWPRLQTLHHQTYNFVHLHTVFSSDSPWILKELLTILLLYPAAALKVALSAPWKLMALAALYASHLIFSHTGDLARAELHDSTCNYLRMRTDDIFEQMRRRERELQRIHPDKGRTDLPLLLLVSGTTPQTPPATSSACPVSPNSLWSMLEPFIESIRYTPSWLTDKDIWGYPFYMRFTYLFPFTALVYMLILAAILYSLCSFFVIWNWPRMYKGRSRPSLAAPICVFFIALYAWLCFFPYSEKFANSLPIVMYENRGIFELARSFFGVFFSIYYMIHAKWFKDYRQFVYGRPQWARAFASYYFNVLTWDLRNAFRPQVETFTAVPAKEFVETVSAELTEIKKAQREHAIYWTQMPRNKIVHRTLDKTYHDPEPNPKCRPRRAGSHPYLTSPFTGRPPGFVKRKQARRPMPDKVTFTGMFYPLFILFATFPSTESYNFIPVIMVLGNEFNDLFHVITPPGWSYFYNYLFNKQYPTLSDSCILISTQPSVFKVPDVLISFLPEITLSIIITYFITIAATELAGNRAPKVLAIECWRAACWGLVLIAFLYIIQLLGNTQSAPVASGYLYVSKGLTVSKLFVTLSSLFVLHLSENYIREHAHHVLEFTIIILLAVLLLLILVSANNLMLLFFSLAGFSLNLYILILYDAVDAASREASLKYFYLSTLSSGFILLGVSLIYVTVGDVTYYAIRTYVNMVMDVDTVLVLSAAVLFILTGFFFKLSAFPGHLWTAEVYEGSPLPVLAFFILPVKVAIFISFMRLLNTGLLDFSQLWLPVVTLAALGSLLWGAFAATQERKTTRFLGYASINQIGFLLLGLIADTDDALRSAFFYLILYAIMSGGFLLIFTHLRQENGAPFTTLSAFRGLGKTENLVCWNLAVFLFSMAGIPPLAGFFGKYYLLSSLMERGLFIPVIIGLAVSLITAYYYLRIIKTFWFEEDIAIKPSVLLLSSEQRTLLSILEASLWVAAVFAPWLLPILTETIATLAVCADSSANAVENTAVQLFSDQWIIANTCDPALPI